MGDWGAEMESATALAYEAADRLREIDPTHELLRFVDLTPQEEALGKSCPLLEAVNKQLMKRRFLRMPEGDMPGVRVATITMANFARTVEVEIAILLSA